MYHLWPMSKTSWLPLMSRMLLSGSPDSCVTMSSARLYVCGSTGPFDTVCWMPS